MSDETDQLNAPDRPPMTELERIRHSCAVHTAMRAGGFAIW